MATTFQEAKAKVSWWVDDTAYGYFTEEQVGRFVNDAQFEVQKLLLQAGQNFYLTCAQTTLVINQADYDFPQDMVHLNRLELITQGVGTVNEVTNPIRAITLNQQDVYPFTTGTPAGYYLKKSKIILVPPPDNSYVLRLTYSYRVSQLTNDNDVVDCPEQFMEMVPLLAAIDCFIKDGRDCSVLLEKKRYYEELLKAEANNRTQDRPRSVVVTTDGLNGVLF